MFRDNINSSQISIKSRRYVNALNTAAAKSAARARRRRNRDKQIKLPIQIDIDAVFVSALLADSGVDISSIKNRDEFKYIAKRFIENVLHFWSSTDAAAEIKIEMQSNEFCSFSRFLMIYGGSSEDPEKWKEFKSSEYSFTGKIQKILSKK